MIEEGLAEGRLDVFCSKNRHIRTLTVSSPVMQVISCRHHVWPRDKIYFLLWDAGIWSVTGSLLEDANVPNDELDLSLVARVCDDTKTLTTPTTSTESDSGGEVTGENFPS